MADFKSMYTKLFNAITDAMEMLKSAQIETEEMFLAQKDADIVVLDHPDDE